MVEDIFIILFWSELEPANHKEEPKIEPATPYLNLGEDSPQEEASSASSGVKLVTPPTQVNEEQLDACYDGDEVLQFRAMDDLVGLGSPPSYAVHNLGTGRLYMVSTEEPSSFAEAEQEAC